MYGDKTSPNIFEGQLQTHWPMKDETSERVEKQHVIAILTRENFLFSNVKRMETQVRLRRKHYNKS
jgi:hypothetical protein